MLAVLKLAVGEAVLLALEVLQVLPPEVLVVPRRIRVVRREPVGRAEVDRPGHALGLLVTDGAHPAVAGRLAGVGHRVLLDHVDGNVVIVEIPNLGQYARVLQGLHHGLGQFELPVRQLGVLPFVLALVAEELPGTVKHVVALRPDAMYVIADLREPAVLVRAAFVLHELLEPVPRQLLVLYVIRLVLLHVGLVLKRELAPGAPAVEMRRPLPEKGAVARAALLRRPVPLEALLDDRRVLPVIIRVHLHVRSGYVHLITALDYTMIMGLLPVVLAPVVSVRTVVHRTVPHETVLQAFVALFVPLEMPDHFFLLHEHPGVAVETVEMLPGTGKIRFLSVSSALVRKLTSPCCS